MKTRLSGNISSPAKPRKRRKEKHQIAKLQRADSGYLTFPSVFEIILPEIFELILKYADKYELSMWAGVCWVFHEFILQKKLLAGAPLPRLDYSRLTKTIPANFHVSEEFINTMQSGDLIFYQYGFLAYLRLGHQLWEVIDNFVDVLTISNFFVVDGRYLIADSYNGVNVWCIRDANGEKCSLKLPFMPYQLNENDFLYTVDLRLRKNNDIVAFTPNRIVSVWRYNSASEQHPYTPDFSGEFDISDQNDDYDYASSNYKTYRNLVYFRNNETFRLWDIDQNTLSKWRLADLRQRLQAVCKEPIVNMTICMYKECPADFYVMKVRVEGDKRFIFFLINLNSQTAPVYLYNAKDWGFFKMTSQGIVVVDLDRLCILSDWNSKSNTFQSSYSLAHLRGSYRVHTISSEGNILFKYYEMPGPQHLSSLAIWDKKMNTLRHLARIKFHILDDADDEIQWLSSGDIAYQSSPDRVRIIDGQTGGFKNSLQFGNRWSNENTNISALPSGDMLISWRQRVDTSTLPRHAIYRFGVWKKPVDESEQQAHVGDRSLVKLPDLLR